MTDVPAYLIQPGLVHITIEGVAPETVLAAAHELTACHNITGPSEALPVPGGLGVYVRQYLYPACLPER